MPAGLVPTTRENMVGARTRAVAFLVAFLGLFAGQAQAAPVTYTFSGNGSGSVGGVNFVGQDYTFRVDSDTATAQNAVAPYTNVLSGGTITIAGTACATGCAITGPAGYIVYHLDPGVATTNVHGISTVGNPQVPGETLVEGCFNCGGTIVDDDLVTPVPLTAAGAFGVLAPFRIFATGGGNVQLTAITSLSYAVAINQQVPTLGEWGAILLSLLLGLGAWVAMRRQGGGAPA